MTRRYTFRTAPQVAATQRYAAEGLSQARTAALLGLTKSQVGCMAKVYKIKFHGEGGGQWGNKNNLGKRRVFRTPEEQRQYDRERLRTWRSRRQPSPFGWSSERLAAR